MKKSLIALAVLAASGAAMAQLGISDQRDRWFRYRDRGFRPIVTDSVVGSS